jgi:hypothetical protein
MLKIIHDNKNPLILVISPLLPEHDISEETKKSIRSNKVQYKWISFASNKKHAANVQDGLIAYKSWFGQLPPYIQVLDRDIICGRKMIDRLYKNLIKQPDNVGYSYCSFEYKGHINLAFPPMKFDIEKLKRGNYISSCSLYRTSVVEAVGGFVTELKYHRMSDWALWLKMYNQGYIGSICYDTSFIAMSTEKDISAGSPIEYHITKEHIIKDFIKP